MTPSKTIQAPLPSGYGPETSARDVLRGVRLDGRNVIVTGGNTGIGLETARALAEAGATVVVAARTPGKGQAALVALPRVTVEPLDLAAPASVAGFAERFLATGRPLHILINNAGIMAPPFGRDARGFVSQLGTNHLGHFELTLRLWPALQRAAQARVVSLSSRGHARASVDLDDPNFDRRPYDKWIAYGQSKTANALFAVALDGRGQARGVRAFAAHPGAVITDLMRSMPEDERTAAVARAREIGRMKTVEQGAATSVWCATSDQLAGRGGVYCEDVDVAQAVAADSASATGVRPWAIDPDLAERLWIKSEGWTGLRFPA